MVEKERYNITNEKRMTHNLHLLQYYRPESVHETHDLPVDEVISLWRFGILNKKNSLVTQKKIDHVHDIIKDHIVSEVDQINLTAREKGKQDLTKEQTNFIKGTLKDLSKDRDYESSLSDLSKPSWEEVFLSVLKHSPWQRSLKNRQGFIDKLIYKFGLSEQDKAEVDVLARRHGVTKEGVIRAARKDLIGGIYNRTHRLRLHAIDAAKKELKEDWDFVVPLCLVAKKGVEFINYEPVEAFTSPEQRVIHMAPAPLKFWDTEPALVRHEVGHGILILENNGKRKNPIDWSEEVKCDRIAARTSTDLFSKVHSYYRVFNMQLRKVLNFKR